MQQHDGLQETVWHGRVSGGTEIAVIPKPGFSTAAGFFGLRYGSNDTHFQVAGQDPTQVPIGSAHFLEHKLFEGREEKVFDRFGAIGADFNGGTGFTSTNYHFISAGRFEQGLEILLDFVQHPLITEERVEKEKGIIEQEVRMYEDMPHFRGLFLLHRALYHNHPVRIPPGGSVDAVRATTAVDLQACFDAFYRPSELKLALAGDFDPHEVFALVDGWVDQREPLPEVTRMRPEEPTAPASAREVEEFSVSQPNIWLGFREDGGLAEPQARLRRRILSALALDLVLGDGAQLHQGLYEQGVLDDTFQTGYSSDVEWGHAVFSGQTQDPARFETGVREALATFVQEGVLEEDLERVRRSAWGSMVGGLQSPAALASIAFMRTFSLSRTRIICLNNGLSSFCIITTAASGKVEKPALPR
ncbi:MAG: insulinase family protein [Planctomycetes bacterium]|nr:insulinase family protein [Planctomycetota bacterium]